MHNRKDRKNNSHQIKYTDYERIEKLLLCITAMNQDKQERLKSCLKELATLLYEEADKSQLTNLESIEKTVRSQMLEYVSPEIAFFLLSKQQEQEEVKLEK